MTVPGIRSRLAAPSEWSLPLCVLAVGTLGLVDDSALQRYLTALDAHVLFGVCLCAFVLLRFRRRMRLLAAPGIEDIRRTSRHLSRMVYLLLGLAVAFKELSGSHSQNLRDYLFSALTALTLIRMAALLYWRSAQRRSLRTAAGAQFSRSKS